MHLLPNDVKKIQTDKKKTKQNKPRQKKNKTKQTKTKKKEQSKNQGHVYKVKVSTTVFKVLVFKTHALFRDIF